MEAELQTAATTTQTKTKTGLRVSGEARKFAFAVCTLLLLTMCVFWLISNFNTQNILQQQANSLGQSLAQQTALQVTELVLANDMISMNVVLNQLTENSSVIDATILNIDNGIIAAASRQQISNSSLLLSEGLYQQYSAPIELEDSVAGYVQIRLDTRFIEQGIRTNLIYVLIATALLLIVAATMTITYFQYLVGFPLRLLSYSLSNIRKGKIATCPEANNNNEMTQTIRQYNSTAEFLAQNTFISNIAKKLPPHDPIGSTETSEQDATILCMQIANYQYLASINPEVRVVDLLNRYYFFADKICQLYNGTVCYSSDGEVAANFSSVQDEDERAFYAVCAGQLFLKLIGNICSMPTSQEQIPAKFKLAVHSGKAVSGLYSPTTNSMFNLMGKTLDTTWQIVKECPDDSMLISQSTFVLAGGNSRIIKEDFTTMDNDFETSIYLCNTPMDNFDVLVQRQAEQLVAMYDNQ